MSDPKISSICFEIESRVTNHFSFRAFALHARRLRLGVSWAEGYLVASINFPAQRRGLISSAVSR
jgi:hypothetical protein